VAKVTARGERILQEALPVWETTQRRFVDALGPRTWAALSSSVRQVVAVAEVLEPRARARRRPGRRPSAAR
jgi:hypothetical protein